MADHTYFKVYMSDVGLLRKKSNINYRTILEGDAAYIHYKGALTENYVYTQLECMGIDCYFWRTKADAELDFITDYEGIKTSLKNVGDNMDGDTHVWSVPLYVLFRFKDYVFNEMGW